jgi:hypothetical protein
MTNITRGRRVCSIFEPSAPIVLDFPQHLVGMMMDFEHGLSKSRNDSTGGMRYESGL